MKETSRFNFGKYKNAYITIEIQSIIPERFINLIWKNNVYIKNIRKKSVTTVMMDIKLKDYYKIEEFAKRSSARIKIVKRWGLSFFILRLKKNRMMVIGVLLFIGIIYYMSTFIWEIQINSDSNLPPYEIRQKLKKSGIVPGINKKHLDVYKIEEFLIKSDDNIMWVKARIDGSRLIISVEERKSPPNIISDNSPCDLAASKDGEVVRLYTTAGTAVVNIGDMVKKGQILVRGIQGKEGATYPVHAAGEVICRTFYEASKSVKVDTIKRVRTGKKIENYYININGRKLYLKKHANNFSKYDKIEESKIFLKKETFYEVKEVPVKGNIERITAEISGELYRKICSNLDKSVKIMNKIVDKKQDKFLKVRVLVVAEENIVSQVEHKEDMQEKDNIGNNGN
ncbi:MAG: sporulation protein YqfD [Clostridium sp.]|jgi:similar to stage IV sporulation protein|uniref:sporulation protein YqfD n=1 Tax=Clostridium sp. TaxID=1506 RepID=UPI0025BCFBC1|nr:sporulation protein YqfD [Clostridium sp.]MCH3964684.1 sporulation protein YqfD [Clostridium sp.]MCI1715155.1 sporulation protein YqfD [Clostridium sp.]MCI1799417.1 sporulation protein YqfD [Clostridium sp.]MCI1813338.1 sporulation protein YqfD [Clostridium sp.]MCI1870229.1 sporulation protein YqfD [Clostridium sp.]